MNPQAGTALQPTKGPVAVKQSAGGDVLDQIQNTYDSIARRAFEILESNGRWHGNGLDDWFRAEAQATRFKWSLTHEEIGNFIGSDHLVTIHGSSLMTQERAAPEDVTRCVAGFARCLRGDSGGGHHTTKPLHVLRICERIVGLCCGNRGTNRGALVPDQV